MFTKINSKSLFNFLFGFYLSLWLTDTYMSYLAIKKFPNVAEYNLIMESAFKFCGIWTILYGMIILIFVYFGISNLMEVKNPIRGLTIMSFGVLLQSFVIIRNLNLLLGS